MQKLPNELLVQIFEMVKVDGEECVEPRETVESMWCSSVKGLHSMEVEERQRELSLWKNTIVPLLNVNSTVRATILPRLRNSLRIEDNEDIRMEERLLELLRQRPGRNHWGYNSLQISLKSDLLPHIFKLIDDNKKTLRSLTISSYGESSEGLISPLAESLSHLSALKHFSYRMNGLGEWIDHKTVMDVLATLSELQALTLFQIHGTLNESNPRSEEPTASAKLRSLHIRRLRHCHGRDLATIVSKSHESLQELTFVFDRHHQPGALLSEHRGVPATQVQEAFLPCKSIRILRIADLTTLDLTNGPLGRVGALDPENGPLGFMVDDMVRSLKQLEILEISGRIFSKDLFENLRMNGCTLQQFSIYNYPGFSIKILAYQLSTNQAFRKLKKLILGRIETIDFEGYPLWKLEKLCTERQIRFITICPSEFL